MLDSCFLSFAIFLRLFRPVDCPTCDEGHKAYYRLLQIRSADEPMTAF
jgi:DNA-directed RNA polymerase subunit M/transcription elongation factor TFIIS